MAKKDWKSGKSKKSGIRATSASPGKKKSRSWEGEQKTAGWSGRSRKKASGNFLTPRRAMLLLLLAAFFGAIAIFVRYLYTNNDTQIVMLSGSEGAPQFLHGDPFANETVALFSANEIKRKDRELQLLSHDGIADTISLSSTMASESNPLAELFGKNDFQQKMRGGPDKDVLLIYVYANGIVEGEGKDQQAFLVTSRTEFGDQESKIPMEDFFKFVGQLGKADDESHDERRLKKVVLLDCGRLRSTINGGLLDSQFPGVALKSLDSLREDYQKGTEDIWLVVSHADGQQGWASPELGASVFGYFVAQCLTEIADADNDGQVGFEEFFGELQMRIAEWVADNRGSIQLPQSSVPAEASDPALVFAGEFDVPPRSSPLKGNSDSDKLWRLLGEGRAIAMEERPLWLAQKEAMLCRAEQLRYGGVRNDKSTSEFEQLIDDLEQDRTLTDPPKSGDEDERLSLLSLPPPSDLELSDFKNRLAKDREQRAVALRAREEAAKGAGGAESKSGADKKSDGDDDADENEKADVKEEPEAASEEELPDLFAEYDPQQLTLLVWHFFADDATRIERFTQRDFFQCMELLETRQGDQSRRALESQFLRLLNDNINWQQPDPRNMRLEALRQAIRVRHASESLIQNSQRQDFADAWRFVQGEFSLLENERRDFEDSLLADRYDPSATNELLKKYREVQNRVRLVRSANLAANDAMWVAHHLHAYLQRELLTAESNDSRNLPDASTVTELLQSGSRLKEQLLGGGRGASYFESLEELELQVDSMLKDWGDSLHQYVDPDNHHTESQFLRRRLFMLETPLPEWLDATLARDVDGNESESAAISVREKLRAEIEGRFAAQVEWQPSGKKEVDSAEANSSMRKLAEDENAAYAGTVRKLVSATHNRAAISSDDGKEPMPVLSNWPDVDADRNLFGELPRKIQKRPTQGTLRERLAARRRQLLNIDLLIRLAAPSLAISANEPLKDVGERINNINDYLLVGSMHQRAVQDLWGNGETKGNTALLFQDNADFYWRGLLDIDVTVEWNDIEDELSADSKQKREAVERVAEFVRSFQIEWTENDAENSSAGTYAVQYRKQDRIVKAQAAIQAKQPAETTNLLIDPRDTMGSMFLQSIKNRQLLESEISPGEDSLDGVLKQRLRLSAAAGHTLQLNVRQQMIRESAQNEFVYAFRGHRVSNAIRYTEKIDHEPLVSYYGSDIQFDNADTIVKIDGDENETTDVMLVLDCSSSMTESRLRNAKTALKKLVDRLGERGRLRAGFAAFAHRSEFIDGYDDAGMRNFRKPIHPALDYESLIGIKKFISEENNAETSDEGFDEIKVAIDKITKANATGRTPLYYSILQAAKELKDAKIDGGKRTSQIVVATDGVNFIGSDDNGVKNFLPQGTNETTISAFKEEWEKYSDFKLHIVLIRPKKAAGTYLEYLERKVREDTTGYYKLNKPRFERLLDFAKQTDNVNLVESSENDIYDELKKFIRFPAFSLEPGDGEPPRAMLNNEITLRRPREKGYSIRLHETDHDAERGLQIFPVGGERLEFDFDEETGLRFKEFAALGDSLEVDLEGVEYQVTKLDEQFRFAFQKAGEGKKFSFRPQRIWAEIRPRVKEDKEGIAKPVVLTAFDCKFELGRPVPVLGLPHFLFNPNLAWLNAEQHVDVRLWATRNSKDGVGQGSELKVRPTVILNPKDKTKENVGFPKSGKENILWTAEYLSRGDSEREIVIKPTETNPNFENGCIAVFCVDPKIEGEGIARSNGAIKVERETKLSDGVVQFEKYIFTIKPSADPEYHIYAQPNPLGSPKKDRPNSRTGNGIDPVFGDAAVWMEFNDVPLISGSNQ